jgi:hypothetical protein
MKSERNLSGLGDAIFAKPQTGYDPLVNVREVVLLRILRNHDHLGHIAHYIRVLGHLGDHFARELDRLALFEHLLVL